MRSARLEQRTSVNFSYSSTLPYFDRVSTPSQLLIAEPPSQAAGNMPVSLWACCSCGESGMAMYCESCPNCSHEKCGSCSEYSGTPHPRPKDLLGDCCIGLNSEPQPKPKPEPEPEPEYCPDCDDTPCVCGAPPVPPQPKPTPRPKEISRAPL